MGGIREEFYSALRAEFIGDDFTKSFLYRYLAREKDDGPLGAGVRVSKRGGPYALLKRDFVEVEQGRIHQEDCLKEVLRILLKTPKLRMGQGTREILWAYGRRLRGGQAFDGMRRDRQRYEALLRMLEEGAPAQRLAPKEWEALREELLKRALEIDAKAFLYDAGFPVSSGEKRGSPRKKDRLLDMLDVYCAENRLSLKGPGGGMESCETDGAWRARFDRFYNTLKRSGKTGILLPVRVDPNAGVGLYIIGKKYYRDIPSAYRSFRGSCCYAFFFLDDLPTEEDGAALTFRADVGPRDYPNLEEALSWYFEKCRENGYRFFRAVNGPVPKDCPEEFRACFEGGPAPPGQGAIPVSREEMEREAAEFGEPPRRGKRGQSRRGGRIAPKGNIPNSV